MAKKKVKPRPLKSVRATKKPAYQPSGSNAMRIVTKNFFLFLVLFVLSVIFGLLIRGEILDNLFWILSILTGSLAVALLLAMLIIFFIRAFRK